MEIVKQTQKPRLKGRRNSNSPGSTSPSGWQTFEEIANRYHLSIRMIAYLAEDGILPCYKVGHAVRFNPVECDQAMRAFRRASKFDESEEIGADER